MPPVAKKFEHNQDCSDDDGGIGDVESVPMVAADVKIDEVGHAAPRDSVEQVSRGPAKDQSHAVLAEPSPSATRGEQPHDQRHHSYGKYD